MKRRNNLVNVMTLQGMNQEREEGVNAFLARLNGQADLCDLQVTCPNSDCQKEVSFKEKFKMLQLVWGLYNKEIQEKVLSAGAALGEGNEMSLLDVVKMVEAAEMGKATQALVSGSGAACRLSEHQKKKFDNKVQKNGGNRGAGGKSDGKSCGYCGRGSHEREQCPAKSAECHLCKKRGHFKSKCCQKGKDKDTKVAEIKATEEPAAVVSTVSSAGDFAAEESELYGDFFRLSVAEEDQQHFPDGWCSPMPTGLSPPMDKPVKVAGISSDGVRHMKCDRLGRWQEGRVEGHGRVRLRATVCKEAYGVLCPPRVAPVASGREVTLLADTGAQMCVTGVRVALQLGLRNKDLVPCSLRINGANNQNLETLGAVFLTLSGRDGWSTRQMVYIFRGVDEFYLSRRRAETWG